MEDINGSIIWFTFDDTANNIFFIIIFVEDDE